MSAVEYPASFDARALLWAGDSLLDAGRPGTSCSTVIPQVGGNFLPPAVDKQAEGATMPISIGAIYTGGSVSQPAMEPVAHPPDPGAELYPAEPTGTQARFMDPAAKLKHDLAIWTGLVKG